MEDLVAQGKTSRAEGKRQKAIDVFETVLERAPGHVEAWVQLGAAYEDLKKWPDALRCYRRALEIAPDNPVAARNLKQLQSFRAVNKPVEVSNPSGEHLIRVGLEAFHRGDIERALQVFRLCRGLLKNDPRPLFYSAIILEREGKVRSAVALYERIIEAFPEFVPARVNLVIALLASGDRQTALKKAEEGLEVLPDNVRLRYLARLISGKEPPVASTARSDNAVTGNRIP
ncbi:MAG: tetratricopeptide repeat protein [Pseudomonadota bacterium]